MDGLNDSPDTGVGLDALERMADRAAQVIETLRERVFAPGSRKQLQLRFTVRRAAAMVGRSEKVIREAEADGRLPTPVKDPETGRRTGYTLADINRMRGLFGTYPGRADTDPAIAIAIQSFKGGVGKTSLACHLAQYLALKGYRVCIIDCDSQASATSLFGLNPDVDIDEDTETLYPFFRHGGPQSLDYTLRATYWPGIAIIPANLGLYDAEYEFAARLVSESAVVLDRLRTGIDTIRDRFDVILMDPPPSLGMISLSVLRAADALIIPAPPNNIDFASTGHFLRMMASSLGEISRTSTPPDYHFVKLVTTKMSETKGAHTAIKRMMDALFPAEMMSAVLRDSAEIDNATANLQTVYELSGADTRTETHRRCRACLDAFGAEVELLVRKTWPSHAPKLMAEGLL